MERTHRRCSMSHVKQISFIKVVVIKLERYNTSPGLLVMTQTMSPLAPGKPVYI